MLTDLSRQPLAETLRTLSTQRKSGDLQARQGKLVKTLFLDHGRVVFAASNLKKDRLGESLIAVGRITDQEFNRAQALMRGERKRRFGESLVQSGVMDKAELGRSVARQVRRIVLSLFEWSEGIAVFEERQSVIPLEFMVSLSVHRLLYDGIRQMKSRDTILAGIGDLDRPVLLAAVPPFAFDFKDCSPEEREILHLAHKRVTLRRLAWDSGGLSLSRLRAAYALWVSGVLQTADTAPVGDPVVQMETGMFLLSVLQRQPDPSGLEAIRKEVHDELERSAKLDREQWLRVARTAPREELIRALEEKMERYHALREAVGNEETLQTDIEIIIGRASAMLRLAKQELPPPPPTPPASPETSAPAGPPDSPVAPEPEELEESKATPPPRAKPVAAPALDSEAVRAQIGTLLMEADVRMTVSDYANAVRVYERIVDLQPFVASHRVKLAIAMAFWPRTAKQAEREFLEAVKLEPDNADLHYQFGLYYKAMRQRARAAAEMRTAVRINPRNQRAREELEVLSPKDSALTSLKKLFR